MSQTAARLKEHLVFFKQFLLHPTEISAVCRTSPALSRLLIKKANLVDANFIVELGPGTGAATTIINQCRKPSSVFLAVEINEHLVEQLSKKCPGTTVIHAPAEDLLTHLKNRNIPHVDVIVSGLPWSSFKISTQNRLLDVIFEALAPGGRFVTLAYPPGLILPTGQAFRTSLQKRFVNVQVSDTVWKNLPPGFVYYAEKPRT